MSKVTEENSASPDFLRPLHRPGRTRTALVTAQLAELSRLPRASVLRRAAATQAAHRWERETLIAVIRAYRRAGDNPAAEAVTGCLVKRLRGAIQAKVSAWETLGKADGEDAAGEAVLKIIGYVSNLTPTEEFWECNFTQCFNQRMNTILTTLTRHPLRTTSLTLGNDDSEARDGLAELEDFQAQRPFMDIEIQETIAALSQANPQMGEYLFLRREGFTDEEIAAQLGKTSRTLRNWKEQARQFLSQNA